MERKAVLARFTLQVNNTGMPIITGEYVDIKKLKGLLDGLSYGGTEELVEAVEYVTQYLKGLTHDLVKRYDTFDEEETLH